MNVLFLSHMYPTVVHPSKGVFVLEQARALRKLGINIRVISPQPWAPALLQFVPRVRKYSYIPQRAMVHGVEVEYPRIPQLPGGGLFFSSGLIYYLSCRGAVRGTIKSSPVDLLHAHAAMPDGFAAALLGREFRIPVVCTLHGSDISLYPLRSRATYVATEWALRHISNLVAVSDDLKQKVKKMKRSDNVRVVQNGADPERFRPIPKLRARGLLSLDCERKLILFVGNLVPVKGVDFLLEAVAQLKKTDFALYIVGDGSMRPMVETRAEQLGISRSCIFAGRRPHDEIPIWLCAADCLVLPSLSEGLPTTILEAMMCRTPVIATAVGGTPEIVVDGDTGFLVPPADATALSSAIVRMLTLPPLQLDAMLDRANHTTKELTWDANARKMLIVYRDALNLEVVASDQVRETVT